MVVGGKEYTVSMVGKLLSYTDMKEDSSLENIDMAYIYTPDGINLYEPLTVNGITFQHLIYDDATGAIKATDADVSFLILQLWSSSVGQLLNGTFLLI